MCSHVSSFCLFCPPALPAPDGVVCSVNFLMIVAVSLLLSACSLIMVQPSHSHERWPARAQRGTKRQQQSRWNRASVCGNRGPLITGPPPKHKVTPKGPEAPARSCSEMFSHVRKLTARCYPGGAFSRVSSILHLLLLRVLIPPSPSCSLFTSPVPERVSREPSAGGNRSMLCSRLRP